jgi:hypothetical protein
MRLGFAIGTYSFVYMITPYDHREFNLLPNINQLSLLNKNKYRVFAGTKWMQSPQYLVNNYEPLHYVRFYIYL